MTRHAHGARRLALVAMVSGSSVLAAQQGAPTLAPAQRDAWAGLLRLLDARDDADTTALDAALGAGDPSLRRAALRGIGQVRMRSRYRVLRDAVAAADTGDAAEAAFALGLARDSLACAALQRGLARGGPVGVEAAWSVGELGTACATVEAMLASAPDDGTKRRVLEVAGRARAVQVAPLIAAAESGAASVRWGALYAMARGRRLGGAALALRSAGDPSAPIREQGARLLARPVIDDSLLVRAGDALRVLAGDPHPHVRIAALRALATHGAVAAPRLLAALGVGAQADRDVNVRVAAAQALDSAVMRDAGAWQAAVQADTTFMVRRSVIVGAMRARIVLPIVTEWRDDADWRRRAAVAEAAGGGGDEALLRFAEPLLGREGDGRVVAAAVGAIAGRVDSVRRVAGRPWRAVLADVARGRGDFYARATALEALAARATATDASLALDAYAIASRDSGNDARLGALRLLAGAWANDSARMSADLRAAIAALPPPDDLLLRAAVRDVGPLAPWRRAPAPSRDLAHYRTIVDRYVAPALAGRTASMTIGTERGTVRVALHCLDVPLTCAVFDELAARRFWRDTRFHRVVPAFVAQDGDPRGDGNGGPGFAIRDELTRRRYLRGAVGMALSGPDTGGSQYFLTLAPQPHLDGRYSVIGTVVAGLEVMDALVQGDAIRELRVTR
ncbi:MAG: peptidylprolyl isomerase [Gemmatimonadaceae bacterium]|nr:peptidylprolyl isomerase [Gemmatimonadaceae bacterium]